MKIRAVFHFELKTIFRRDRRQSCGLRVLLFIICLYCRKMCRPTNDWVSICLCLCHMLTRCSGKYRSDMRTAHMLKDGRSQLLLLLSLLLLPYTNVTQIGSRHADYREWQNVTVPRFTRNFIRLRKTIKKQTKPNNLRCFRSQQWIEWNLMSCVLVSITGHAGTR